MRRIFQPQLCKLLTFDAPVRRLCAVVLYLVSAMAVKRTIKCQVRAFMFDESKHQGHIDFYVAVLFLLFILSAYNLLLLNSFPSNEF